MREPVLSKTTKITEVRAASMCLEQVRATVDKVLAIVRNPNRKSGQKENLRAQLAEVIYPRFHFAEMAKRSLGPHWGRRTAEEQQEFVKIFAGLLGRSYADSIESYTSQNVLYTRELEDNNYAEVDTKIVADKRVDLSINYKLHSVNNEWKVYDLVIENISLVNNYPIPVRSRHSTIFFRGSRSYHQSKKVVASTVLAEISSPGPETAPGSAPSPAAGTATTPTGSGWSSPPTRLAGRAK